MSLFFVSGGQQGPPGPTGPAGAGVINWRGAWSAVADYEVNDAVNYLGSSYIVIEAHTNELPTDTDFWNPLALKGDTGVQGIQGEKGDEGDQGLQGEQGEQGNQGEQGEQGEGVQWKGDWSDVLAYEVNDIVHSGGNAYICVLAHTNQEPPNITYWALFVQKGDTGLTGDQGEQGEDGEDGLDISWLGAWDSLTEYVVNDAVSFGGSSYICILANDNQTPPNPTYWNVMAEKGDTGDAGAPGDDGADGADGESFIWQDAYDNGTAYAVNDVVSYLGSSYIATAPTTGNLPTDTYFWSLMAQKGDTGDTGATGDPGADGDDGAAGAAGAAGRDAGIKFIYDDTTTTGNPGSGKFRLIGLFPSAATQLDISETDADGNSIASWLQSWDDSTNTVKAYLFIQKEAAPANLLIYSITGSVTDNGAYDSFTIGNVVESGSFSNGDAVRVWVDRFGNVGATGSAGSNGSNGSNGTNGTNGRMGGIKFTFNSSTTMADPGAGKFRLNGGFTSLAIDPIDADANNVAGWITSWITADADPFGTLFIQSISTGQIHGYEIDGLIDGGGWYNIAVTQILSAGGFSNGEDCVLFFQHHGDTGATGAAGGANTITADTTLYVATTGNDTTGDGSSGLPWLTVAKALDYLTDKFIASDATVTILLADGAYAITTALNIEHPCGSRIVIKGTNVNNVNMTSIQSSSGSAGAYSYIINVNTITGVAVDDYVMILSPSGGTLPKYMVGCHKVTNVDVANTRITITVKHYNASKASSAVAAGLFVLKTRITCTSCDAFSIKPNTTVVIRDMAIVGDATASKAAFFIAGNSVSRGGNGHLTIQGNTGTDNFGYGLYCRSGSVTASDTPTFSGSITNGVRLEDGARAWFNGGVIINGGQSSGTGQGLNVKTGAVIYAQNSTITGNNSINVRATENSTLWLKSSELSGCLNVACLASTRAFVEIGGGTISGNFLGGLFSDTEATISTQEGSLTMSGNVLWSQDRTLPYAALPTKFRQGFYWSRNSGDTTNDIDIGAGSCRDDSDVDNLVLTSTYTKRLDAGWAVGSGAGGLDTGARAANTWYYIWIIKRPDTGVVDVLLSTSNSSPTMPTGYTLKRLVGAAATAMSLIIEMKVRNTGNGIYVQYLDPAMFGLSLDIANTTLTRTTRTYSWVPLIGTTGDSVMVDANVELFLSTGTLVCYFTNPNITDTVPSSTASPLFTGMSPVSNLLYSQRMLLVFNHAAQLCDRCLSASGRIRVQALGWWWPGDA